MVKVFQTAFQGKRLLGVAFPAIPAQVAAVHIFVATVAVTEGYSGELLKCLPIPVFFPVAFDAGYRFVFTRESKIRFVVVEPSSWGKSVCIVASCTIS